MNGEGGGGGGWRGSMGTVGGLTRTFGLHKHFAKPEENGPPVPITKAILKRIGRYFRPYWRQWLIILFCILITSGLSVLPPFCVGMILDEALPEKKTTLLALLAGAMVLIAVTVGLIGVLQQTLTTRSGQNIMFDLKNEMYRHLQQMSLHFFTSNRSGEIISRINNDVNAIQGVATGTIVSIVSNVAILTATSIALFTRNWKLALLAIAVVPAFYMPSRIVGRIRNRLATETQESYASLMGFLFERLNVSGSLLMKIFGRRSHDAEEFATRTERVRDLNIRQAIVGRWLFMILSAFSALGPALIYWYGGLQVLKTELTPGLLVAFAALLTLLYRPLTQLATVYADIQGSVAVFYRIFEYLDMKPIVQDKPDARSLPVIRGHIVFENVCFSYPRKPLPPVDADAEPVAEEGPDLPPKPFAMENVSFEINPGTQVALVGPSGAGKTTITYLLPRFYDPDSGRITLDGVDLRDIAQESLRSHVGMVTQETYLFHSSIRANLLYAKPDATQDEMIDACKAANIHDFVIHLPDGYDTVVGDRGFRLSGGEKQRVSIARALLKNPSILILDEATSSLDATSEYLIQEALEKLLHGRTSLIIAHRLSTILSSHKIVVMDTGRIVESGPHADLLHQNGLYARLFQQQFSKVLNPPSSP